MSAPPSSRARLSHRGAEAGRRDHRNGQPHRRAGREPDSLLYSFSKLQEFFGSLYLKVVLVVSAICAIIYVAWVLLNSPHTRHSSKKVHRYGRPRD